jgi:pimeloyl-ACP methyl ester carboxylesterase
MRSPPSAGWFVPERIVRLADRLTPPALALTGFRSVRVKTNAGLVHVLEVDGEGSLPPFLMLHGLGSCASDYVSLVRGLRSITRKLILPDMPGHGLSEPPTGGMNPAQVRVAVRDALDARVGEPSFVFGNSLGGLAAVRFAQMRPERTLGLILASPGGAAMSPEELAALLATFDLPSHASAVAFVDRFLAAPAWYRDVLALGVRARMNRASIRDLLRRISTEDLLTADDLRELAMPVYCFWGAEDDVLPAQSRDFFRRHLPPHALFEAPAGFGHAPYIDQPAVFLEKVRAFAESVMAGRPPG